MMDMNALSRVELYLSARRLPRMDTFSKSDPMCVVWLKEQSSGKWNEVGRTEYIMNDEDPSFKTKIEMDYYFEEAQELKFEFYDIDSKSNDLSKHDYMGYALTTLGKIASAAGQSQTMQLLKKNGQAQGKASVTVRMEEQSGSNDMLKLSVSGVKLDKMDFFGASDPYLEFYRIREDNSWVPTKQTEVIKKTLNPRWQPFDILARDLCGGDMKRPLLVKCFDWNRSGKADFIGQFETCLADMLAMKEAGQPVQFKLIQPNHKKQKNREKSHGTIVFNRLELIRNHSFLDYIKGGMQVGLMVAVDFTGSNGNPMDPSSLHYRYGNGALNPYQQAIATVANVVLQYDSDGMVPLYGFGGRVNGAVSHCFPLNMNPAQPEVAGVDGIMRAYDAAFQYVALSGPTYFSEIIQTADVVASQPYTQESQHYTILLILTDGIINDMDATIECIVGASVKPLSIIIVGVGNADFSNMNRLDGDDVVLTSRGGKRAARDIVQFVPFNEFKNKHISMLAKEVLAEIPAQLTSFARSFDIAPLPARSAPPPLLHQGSMAHLAHQPSMANLVAQPSMANIHQQLPPGGYAPAPMQPMMAGSEQKSAPGYPQNQNPQAMSFAQPPLHHAPSYLPPIHLPNQGLPPGYSNGVNQPAAPASPPPAYSV